MQKSVIIDYRGFTPINDAFERLGYRVLASADGLAEAELRDCELALYCMFISIKRPLQSWRLRRRLNRAGVPVIAWNRDGPSNKGEKAWRLWLLHHVEYFNIYATHTLQDSAGFGSRILYLPNAAWDTEYQLGGVTLEALRDASRYERDVSFFGRINASRYPEMREREAFFRRLGSRLAALGVAYAFIDDPLSYAQQRKLIQTSRINLSFFAGCDACYHGAGDPSREKSWGMPERCFGVPACGGFLLSDTRKHARDDFSPGRDWVDFVDLDDCIEKIRYYLAAFAENRVIAEAAYARVLREHTYVHRARALIDAASEWREARAMTRERHGIHLP